MRLDMVGIYCMSNNGNVNAKNSQRRIYAIDRLQIMSICSFLISLVSFKETFAIKTVNVRVVSKTHWHRVSGQFFFYLISIKL